MSEFSRTVITVLHFNPRPPDSWPTSLRTRERSEPLLFLCLCFYRLAFPLPLDPMERRGKVSLLPLHFPSLWTHRSRSWEPKSGTKAMPKPLPSHLDRDRSSGETDRATREGEPPTSSERCPRRRKTNPAPPPLSLSCRHHHQHKPPPPLFRPSAAHHHPNPNCLLPHPSSIRENLSPISLNLPIELRLGRILPPLAANPTTTILPSPSSPIASKSEKSPSLPQIKSIPTKIPNPNLLESSRRPPSVCAISSPSVAAGVERAIRR